MTPIKYLTRRGKVSPHFPIDMQSNSNGSLWMGVVSGANSHTLDYIATNVNIIGFLVKQCSVYLICDGSLVEIVNCNVRCITVIVYDTITY